MLLKRTVNDVSTISEIVCCWPGKNDMQQINFILSKRNINFLSGILRQRFLFALMELGSVIFTMRKVYDAAEAVLKTNRTASVM